MTEYCQAICLYGFIRTVGIIFKDEMLIYDSNLFKTFVDLKKTVTRDSLSSPSEMMMDFSRIFYVCTQKSKITV